LKLRINKDSTNVMDAYDLSTEDVLEVADIIFEVVSDDSINYPTAVLEVWERLEDSSLEKKVFAVFSLGRLFGIMEAILEGDSLLQDVSGREGGILQ